MSSLDRIRNFFNKRKTSAKDAPATYKTDLVVIDTHDPSRRYAIHAPLNPLPRKGVWGVKWASNCPDALKESYLLMRATGNRPYPEPIFGLAHMRVLSQSEMDEMVAHAKRKNRARSVRDIRRGLNTEERDFLETRGFVFVPIPQKNENKPILPKP